MESTVLFRQVNTVQEDPTEDYLQEGVKEQQRDSDRLSAGPGVANIPTLPPIPTIRFGACFM